MENNKDIKEQKVINRDIKVLEGGDIEVEETLFTRYTQKYRDYLSDYRMVLKWIDDVKNTMTEEFQEERRKDLDRALETKEDMDKYLAEAEDKFNAKQKEVMLKQKYDYLKSLLDKKDDKDLEYLKEVYNNLDEDFKELLSKEELDLLETISKK
ncbi:MAG: hypothetical protein EOL97_14405 [Spirochaetia bacterium]|nr:hypothetical protein [Spirochaetia bacterium]